MSRYTAKLSVHALADASRTPHTLYITGPRRQLVCPDTPTDAPALNLCCLPTNAHWSLIIYDNTSGLSDSHYLYTDGHRTVHQPFDLSFPKSEGRLRLKKENILLTWLTGITVQRCLCPHMDMVSPSLCHWIGKRRTEAVQGKVVQILRGKHREESWVLLGKGTDC